MLRARKLDWNRLHPAKQVDVVDFGWTSWLRSLWWHVFVRLNFGGKGWCLFSWLSWECWLAIVISTVKDALLWCSSWQVCLMCAQLCFFRIQNAHTLADVGFVPQIAVIAKFTRFCSIKRSSANFWGEPHLGMKRSGPDFANATANLTWERARFGQSIVEAVQTLYFVA